MFYRHYSRLEVALMTSRAFKKKIFICFAKVYLVDQTVIRKVPLSKSEEHVRPISREATIYGMIGNHPRIAEYLSLPEEQTNFVPEEQADSERIHLKNYRGVIDLKYYPEGDLAELLRTKEPTEELIHKWFGQIIEGVAVIHRLEIIHSDLRLEQILVDDENNARLSDFNASQYPNHVALGYEKATHCLPRDYTAPNTTSSDLFALGSTLYEFVTRHGPYDKLYADVWRGSSADDDELRAQIRRKHIADYRVEQKYKHGEFPNVSEVFGGDIILGLWNGTITSTDYALTMYERLI
ncbi:kinase-like protein [Penicillium herquei]|nr:kinase-like protein [Penicillium herquei]